MATLVPFAPSLSVSSVLAVAPPPIMDPPEDVPSAAASPAPLDSPRSGEEYVIKRDGRRVPIDYNKISRRLKRLKLDVEKAVGHPLRVSIFRITQSTIRQIYNGITTSELDEEAAEVASGMTDDPDYADFAGAILASNLEANNRDTLSFAEYAKKAYGFVEERTKEHCPLISKQLFDLAQKYGHLIDRRLVMERNLTYGYFAFKTLAKGNYLLSEYRTVQKNKMQIRMMVPFETPQHALMRVALGLHGSDMDAAFELYDNLSEKKGTMATPTLFFAGTPRPQLSSCFLLAMKDDSLSGIYDTLKDCAMVSRDAGGIGLHVHNIRSTGSYIKGTNGTSNGLVPMLRVFNNTAKYVDQGGSRRPGSFAIYLEPWHADVLEFLDLKRPHGAEDQRARDLFYALWVPDLFFKRIQQGMDTMWSLMDPKQCPGLSDTYGEEFEALYTQYERDGQFVKQIPIRRLVEAILTTQIETGTPYILAKDACNRKSNQKNLGTIKSSNLCTEIIEFSSPDETGTCNLASLSLPAFVDLAKGQFDYQALYRASRVFIRALDRVVDINHYPIESARRSNLRHRPLGLGVQGLADVFCLLRLRFGSEASKVVNRRIAETMYFAALTESHALTQVVRGPSGEITGPYPSIDENGGAPIRHGLFQFDLWKDDFKDTDTPDGWRPDPELGWDWEDLRTKVQRDGVRNSLLIAPMPTASTSIILGNVEAFEPYYGMIYVRSTKSGEFYQMCRPLVEELIQRGLWEVTTHPTTGKSYIPLKDKIMAEGGSIQNIAEIPDDLKEVFVCITDLKLKDLTEMARDRGVFTDQSMSLNVHFRNKDDLMPDLLKYMLFAWKLGLKTISYYTRTIQKLAALNFTGKDCVVCSA